MNRFLYTLSFYFCLILYSNLNAQCTFASPYANAVINSTSPGYSVTITTCQWGGEYATLNFNVTGAFTFSSSNSGDYFTLTNISNSVIASGSTPLNAVILTTGTYYLHTAASGPPLCATQNICRTTRVLIPFPPCTGTPVTGSASAFPSVICPNTSATLTLPGSSNTSGLAYQWFASTTGSMGTYVPIPGSGSAIYQTAPSVSVTTWYRAVIACSNSGLNATSPPVSVGIAGTTTNSIPYSEGFEGLIIDNQLPNCSWKASNLPQTCQTYIASNSNNRIPRTGSKFASFYYLPSNASYFYTNALQLKSGVTYSASVWYTTEYNTYTNWSNLSILLGPNQSTLGLQTIASSNGAAASPIYKSLSNTFTVASNGLYYVAIKASSTGSCCAQYLSFDDLEITAPCSLNSPNASIVASSDTICNGQTVLLNAIGADTYSWSIGGTNSSILFSPSTNTLISVVCTNTLSACSVTLSKVITVINPIPVSIFIDSYTTCPGKPVTLTAYGVNTYSWNIGTNNAVIQVTPNITSSYTVVGTDLNGCTSQASATISVNPLPELNVSTSKNIVCVDEPVTFTAQGASTYTWQNNNALYFGNPLILNLSATSTLSLIGKDISGCTNTFVLVQNVDECTQIVESNSLFNRTSVFPNPNQGLFTLTFLNSDLKRIEVYDATGKLVFNETISERTFNVHLQPNMALGIYSIRIVSGSVSEQLKVIVE